MISLQVFMTGLLAVSIFTTLATQAIKKLIRECNGKVYVNILTSIVSVVISAGLGIAYGIVKGIPFDAVYIILIIALAFLGWLCAMNGYDKVKQAIEQILKGGDIDGKSDNDE